MGAWKDGFQPLRYVMVPGVRTSGAEAQMYLSCFCRPEGLLHPVVNNVG
jgi:hypothetical protein